jgi:hypothetical protein
MLHQTGAGEHISGGIPCVSAVAKIVRDLERDTDFQCFPSFPKAVKQQ